jgi:DNA-binding NtrC family response regulator
MEQIQSKRRKVLIVEDDTELRLLTKVIFEECQFDIIECESAEAALATMLLRGKDVAMIFADVRLSGEMDGIGLAREVKMRWPHLIVVPAMLSTTLVNFPRVWSTCLSRGRL